MKFTNKNNKIQIIDDECIIEVSETTFYNKASLSEKIDLIKKQIMNIQSYDYKGD